MHTRKRRKRRGSSGSPGTSVFFFKVLFIVFSVLFAAGLVWLVSTFRYRPSW